MNEFKGTKGKWTILHDRLRQFEDTRNFRVPIASKYGREINSGYLNAHVYGRDKNQCLYNAQLIAHAPEMLEMLQSIMDKPAFKEYFPATRIEVLELIKKSTTI